MGLVCQGDFVGEAALSQRIKQAQWVMFCIKQMKHRRHVSVVTGALASWAWCGTQEAVRSRTSVETTTWA